MRKKKSFLDKKQVEIRERGGPGGSTKTLNFGETGEEETLQDSKEKFFTVLQLESECSLSREVVNHTPPVTPQLTENSTTRGHDSIENGIPSMPEQTTSADGSNNLNSNSVEKQRL